jgi:hypothetical protein
MKKVAIGYHRQRNSMDRKKLNFPEIVQKHFSFLNNYGYKINQRNETFVQYTGKEKFINIFHGRKSYELGLEIGSLKNPENTYSIYSLLMLIDKKKADNYKVYAARTVTSIEEGLTNLAEHFRFCISSETFNDANIFGLLYKQRLIKNHEYALNVKLAHMREALEKAWSNKNYRIVVEILEPFEKNLTSVEAKKLTYAKKKIMN